MNVQQQLDRLLTVSLIGAAVTFSAVMLHRQFMSGPQVAYAAIADPRFEPRWKEALPEGMMVGPPEAAVRIVEFVDFECPSCAATDPVLVSLTQRYPDDVVIYYVHFPLQMHTFAIEASHAVECAAEQNRLLEMKDLLYSQQRRFGFVSWHEFATAAEIPDLDVFDECMDDQKYQGRIDAGKALGESLQVTGTPTVIVNGWRLGAIASVEQMSAFVDALLSGDVNEGSSIRKVRALLTADYDA